MKPKCWKGNVFSVIVLLCIFFVIPAVNAVAKRHTGGERGNLTEQKTPENADIVTAGKTGDMADQAPAGGLEQTLAGAGVSSEEEENRGARSPIGRAFFKAQEAAAIALMRVGALYTDLSDESDEWNELKVKLSGGRGLPHLLMTLFIVAMIIAGGVIVERLFNRYTEDIRQGILSIAPLGRLKKIGRVLTRILLDALGICVYVLTTFLLFVLIYQKGEAGFIIASISIIGTYYLVLFVFAAKVICSPSSPSLRLLPLQDEDAVFLYRWLVLITSIACFLAVVSTIFKEMGISQELFYLLYSTSGIAVVVLLILMILQGRERVTRAICEDTDDGTCESSPFLDKLSRRWHFFAILYVVGAGVYWHANMLLEGKGDIVHLLMSIFLVPIFIGIDQWGQKLLKIASGELTETIDLSGTDDEVSQDETAAEIVDAETTEHDAEHKKTEIKHFVPFIRRAFRFLLGTFLFFALLRLWGIDLPLGRLLASQGLSIIVVLLLGVITWELAKAWIDRKIEEEMPDMEEEAEEGGAGGSRIGTLLVLLRKFILTVLFIIVSLIILSSIGVNIGPLIAGAGVIGLAIGFGAQTLVKDIIAGIFFLLDDAFRVGDYIETSGKKGTVEHISLRSLRLRHPRGMVHTIPFGGMGTVTNNSRDYVITKLEFRVRYDTDVDKVRKIVKRINMELQQDEAIAACLLGKIKSQGVRELDDSAMIMRVKYTAIPGKQFLVRKELFRLMQERFRENGIEFAHRNVTVYLPEDETHKESADNKTGETTPAETSDTKRKEAAAAAAQVVIQADEEAAAAAAKKTK